MHPNLARLDALARHVRQDPRMVAVLGLGSTGQETQRFDDHSDLDFFLVTDTVETKWEYVGRTDWLAALGGELVYLFAHEPHGRKGLMADGLFLEYAIFTPEELRTIPFHGARVVWGRDDFQLVEPPPPPRDESVDYEVNRALTHLLVGMHRDCRGEHLSGMRWIQFRAVDSVLALQRLDDAALPVPDLYQHTRRVETASGAREVPLAQMCQGYGRNPESAAAVLAWLRRWYSPAEPICAAIDDLVAEARAGSPGC